MTELILYSKPGCHLCEGLQEKLEQIPSIVLTVRDISTQEEWFQAYQYLIPILCVVGADGTELPLPRMSPRLTTEQVKQMLQKSLVLHPPQ